MRIRLMVAWYDLWVGAFWDRLRHRLYIFPLPMIGLQIQFGTPPAEVDWLLSIQRSEAELDREREAHRAAIGSDLMHTAALQVAEAELASLKTNPGPVSDSQCDRCQLDSSVRADKAEAALAERDRMLDAAVKSMHRFSVEFWVLKGLNKEQAEDQAKSATEHRTDLRARAEEREVMKAR